MSSRRFFAICWTERIPLNCEANCASATREPKSLNPFITVAPVGRNRRWMKRHFVAELLKLDKAQCAQRPMIDVLVGYGKIARIQYGCPGRPFIFTDKD